MTLQIFAVLVLGLVCGSELNLAAFGHPVLNRQSLQTHIAVRASLARLFGRVMPFWMGGSTLLNLLLLFPFGHLDASARRLAVISFAIQAAAVVFSIIAPVPINNRIAKWMPQTLPGNWEAQERRWDHYHWFRTASLIVAFALLILSVAVRG